MTDSPISPILKPCPFCADTPILDIPVFEICRATNWGAIVCATCDCSGPTVRTYKAHWNWRSQAIAAWNTRTPSVESLIAELEVLKCTKFEGCREIAHEVHNEAVDKAIGVVRTRFGVGL